MLFRSARIIGVKPQVHVRMYLIKERHLSTPSRIIVTDPSERGLARNIDVRLNAPSKEGEENKDTKDCNKDSSHETNILHDKKLIGQQRLKRVHFFGIVDKHF